MELERARLEHDFGGKKVSRALKYADCMYCGSSDFYEDSEEEIHCKNCNALLPGVWILQ